MKNAKKNLIWILVGILILALAGLFFYLYQTGAVKPQAAATTATLTLSPASGNYVVGSTITTNIVLNTGGQAVDSTQVRYIRYNPALLQVQDDDASAAGTQIAKGTIFPNYPINTVDATNGRINVAGIINTGGTPYTGSAGVFGTIHFKVLTPAASTPVTIDFTLGSTTDSNVVASSDSTDILNSVGNASYVLNPPTYTTTTQIQLQGRTNFATTATDLKILTPGTSTLIVEKNDITTAASGAATFTLSAVGLSAGTNYDYQLKPTYYLSKKILNTAFADSMTLTFSNLRAGDLDNSNLVNSLDFSILNTKWDTADSVADINQDGLVNTIDFSLLNSNWFQSGQ